MLLKVIKVKCISFVATHNYVSTISISYSHKNLGKKIHIVTIVHCTYSTVYTRQYLQIFSEVFGRTKLHKKDPQIFVHIYLLLKILR